MLSTNFTPRALTFAATAALLLCGASAAYAASGTWNSDSAGNWSDTTKWNLGTVADGTDSTATFSNVITVDRTVTLDTNRTIGNITASDTSNNYTISGANTLTLDVIALTPVIDVTTAGRTLTISSQIAGSDGLQKNGAGQLTLSGANTFTGGVTLNGGTLFLNAPSALGSAMALTVTATSTLNASNSQTYNWSALNATAGILTVDNSTSKTFTFTSATGSGTVVHVGNGNGTLNLNNASAFTGTLISSPGSSSTGNVTFTSLSDAVGAGNLQFGTTGAFTTGAANFTFQGDVGPLTFNNRAIAFSNANSTITAARLVNNNATAANTWVINTNLIAGSSTATRTLELGGTNTGANTFAGNITNTSGGGVVSVAKAGAGRWDITGNMSHTGGLTVSTSSGGLLNLSGTNTYSGATVNAFSNPATGFLAFQGMQALSPNTSLQQTHAGGVGGHGTIKLLDDSATPASRSTVNLTHNQSNGSQNVMSLFVGNNSVANGGTSASTQTGSTIQLGNMNFTQSAVGAAAGAGLTVNGANDYKLQLANVNVSLLAGYAANWNVRLLANAPIIVGGNVQQAAGGGAATTTTLQLDGTATGSEILGNVLNSADGTPRLLSVTKLGAGTWTLAGTNAYTGTTAISGGILRFTGNSSAATGNVTVSGGALGGTGTVGGAVTVSSTGGIDLLDGAVGNLTLSSTLNITGATGANSLKFDLGNATNTTDKIIAGGATTVTNAGAAVISLKQLGGLAGRNTAGSYTLIDGTTSMAAVSQFALQTTKAFGQTFTLSVVGNDLILTTTQEAAVTPAAFWKGGTNNWSLASNWNSTVAGGGAAGAAPDYQTNVTFSTTTPVATNTTTNVLDVDFDINSLNFNSLTGGVTISGSPRTLTIEATNANGNTAGSGINATNTSGTNTISAKVLLASAQTWTQAAGGTLSVLGGTDNGGNTLTFSGNGTFNFDNINSVITGSGGIVKNGTGNLILSAGASPLHNFTGGLTLNGGKIAFQSSAFFANGNTTITDGYLAGRFGSGYTWSGLGTGLNQIQITGGTSGFSGEGNTGSTFQIGSAGSTLIWGSDFFNPTVLIAGGAGGNAFGKGALNNGIDLNGANRTITSTLVSDNAAASGFTISGAISNSSVTAAGLTKTGVGNVILAGANTFNGPTTLSAGFLTLGNALALQNSALDTTASIAGSATAGLRTTVTTLTLGGLNGNKNFAATGGVFTSATGGYGAVTALTLNPAAADSHSYSGVLANGAANMTLTIAGAGAQYLSGPNTFSGKVVIGNNTAGTLKLQVNSIGNVGGGGSALGAPTTVANGLIQIGATSNSSTLEFINLTADQSSDRQVQIGSSSTGSGGAFILNNDADNSVTFSNPAFNVASAGGAFNRILRLGGSNTGNNTISGAIIDNVGGGSGLISLTKQDAGKWILGGTNLYSGPTTINGGTLLVNGSTAAGSAVTVNSGATLGGTGAMNGTVTINPGGHLAPGNSIGIMGSGPLVIAGVYDVELGNSTGAGTHASPFNSDRTNVTGTLNYAGATLNLIDNAGADGNGSVSAGSYQIFTYSVSNGAAFGSITGPSSSLHAKVVDDGANGSGGIADGVFLDVYRLASASAHSPEPINFGTVLTGTPLSQTLSVTNNAASDGFSESLNGSIGSPTGDATTTFGSFSLLAAGATNNVSLAAGISTATAGSKSGTATISLDSDGTGTSDFGTTALSSQTVNLSAIVLDPAAASFTSPASSTFLNLNIGTFDQNSGLHSASFDIFNLLQTIGFTADLDLDSYALFGPDDPNLYTDPLAISNLAPGNSISFLAWLNTANIGAFTETYILQLSSSGFADPSQTLTLNISGAVEVVPEPASVAVWTVIGLGLAGYGVRRVRRQRFLG